MPCRSSVRRSSSNIDIRPDRGVVRSSLRGLCKLRKVREQSSIPSSPNPPPLDSSPGHKRVQRRREENVIDLARSSSVPKSAGTTVAYKTRMIEYVHEP